ncbi:MAG: hypothetical protein ACRCW6_00590 [Mycoplasmoidaceae bacterium]
MKIIWKNDPDYNLYLNQSEDLWVKNFKEPKIFSSSIINKYKSLVDSIFLIDNQNLISMAFIVSKNIVLENMNLNIYLIIGVATNKKWMNKGNMNIIMNEIFKKYENYYIFMQSYSWEYYKKWNLLEVSYMYQYQYCNLSNKKIVVDKRHDWKKMLEIFNNQGSIKHNLNSFKDYMNKFKYLDARIISIQGTYIVLENNIVIEYAYKDLETLENLLIFSNAKEIMSFTKITSKKFILKKKLLFTKSNKILKNVIFNTLF